MGGTKLSAVVPPWFSSAETSRSEPTGGVEVVGSNPVSPTDKSSGELRFPRGFSSFLALLAQHFDQTLDELKRMHYLEALRTQSCCLYISSAISAFHQDLPDRDRRTWLRAQL